VWITQDSGAGLSEKIRRNGKSVDWILNAIYIRSGGLVAKVAYKGALVARIVGRVGNMVFAATKGNTQIMRGVYRKDPATEKQKSWHQKYNVADFLWSDLTQAEKNIWRKEVKRPGQSNYSMFMHVNLIRVRDGKEPTRLPIQNGE